MSNNFPLQQEANELIMFYNVENLYSPDPKPIHKFDPTISGLRNWDERKYNNKLFKISQVFEFIKQEHSYLPLFIGLSEIQGEKVINDLLKSEIFENKFSYIHYDSMDERGIDVALLYDKTKIEIIDSETISYIFEIEDQNPENYDTTRDVLHVKAKYDEEQINIFVLHLPSKRENDVNKPKRDYILADIRKKIIKLAENQEAVILLGDFNENPNDDNLINLLTNDAHLKILTNPFTELLNNHIYSTFHYKDGLVFDQILLSNNFFKENFPLKYEKAYIFNHKKISNWDKKFAGRPFRTYAGTRYLGGYSDHFPVLVKLKKINF